MKFELMFASPGEKDAKATEITWGGAMALVVPDSCGCDGIQNTAVSSLQVD